MGAQHSAKGSQHSNSLRDLNSVQSVAGANRLMYQLAISQQQHIPTVSASASQTPVNYTATGAVAFNSSHHSRKGDAPATTTAVAARGVKFADTLSRHHNDESTTFQGNKTTQEDKVLFLLKI